MTEKYKNIPGWTDVGFFRIYDRIVDEAKDGDIFIEIGCWKGRSSLYILEKAQEANKKLQFHFYDTFTGDEYGSNQATDMGKDLPNFIKTLNDAGFYDFNAKAIDSIKASELFTTNEVFAIMLDGCHVDWYVHKELLAWKDKCKNICGHDYKEQYIRKSVREVLGQADDYDSSYFLEESINNMDIKYNDDYDFVNEYPNYHAWQTKDLENKGLKFELNDFSIENDTLKIKDNLCNNQKLLYNTIFDLQPRSVFEVGFGYGNHLHSIKKICPKIEINGCEISYRQYNSANLRYDLSECNLELCDFLLLNSNKTYDFVYSNAVVMHLSTEKQKRAIEKMYDISDNYIMLLDGRLQIPNLHDWIKKFPNVVFMESFATKYWTEYQAPPIFISKHKEHLPKETI